MKICDVKERTPELINKLILIWENSVKATHLFLSDKEIQDIKGYVPQAIKEVEILFVAEDEYNCLIAFMGINKQRLEMLFISSEKIGNGLGKKLLELGIEKYKINEVTVNEDNPQAVGFYKHMGFQVYKRTAKDEQGAPYPLLYMKR